MQQQDKPKTKTTTAKANSENTAMENTIGALSGLSSVQSGKTGAERATGIAKIATAIAGLFA